MAKTIKASFDVTTPQGKIKAFNAQNGASVSLKTLSDGEVITVVDVMQYEEVVDSYGQSQEATVTVLFAADGKSYAGISDTVSKAAENLIDLLQDDAFESIDVAIVKQKSARGQEFLNLRAMIG